MVNKSWHNYRYAKCVLMGGEIFDNKSWHNYEYAKCVLTGGEIFDNKSWHNYGYAKCVLTGGEIFDNDVQERYCLPKDKLMSKLKYRTWGVCMGEQCQFSSCI